MPHSNDCWQADTSHGPYLTINGKKTLTYLIAIIDDASRFIVGAKFFFNDNSINLQDVFKSSIKKYGVPKKLLLIMVQLIRMINLILFVHLWV